MSFAQFYLHIVYFILLDPAFKKEEFNKQEKKCDVENKKWRRYSVP